MAQVAGLLKEIVSLFIVLLPGDFKKFPGFLLMDLRRIKIGLIFVVH